MVNIDQERKRKIKLIQINGYRFFTFSDFFRKRKKTIS